MRISPTDEERLQLLNQAQPDRPWRSCSEKRRCIICDRTFRGSAVEVRADRDGLITLTCPGCQSASNLWVRPGNPLTDETVWSEWDLALRWLQQKEELAF